MADPLLTSLCAICHVQPPVYKCPRCGIRTCSLPCITKHKSWSECSGRRDPTVYMPPSKLRTPAGVDHDYNFLHGIERSVESAERLVVGERRLVREADLRPLTVQEVRWKPGRDGRKRKVVVTRVLREAKGRVLERLLAQRLKKLNITLVCAPAGMSRQKENHTTFNRKSGRVNWQVEWLAFVARDLADAGNAMLEPSRTLSKVMDDVPLYEAYHSLLQAQSKNTNTADITKDAPRPKLPTRLCASQNPNDSTWSSHPHDSIQDPLSRTWTSTLSADTTLWPSEADAAKRQQYQFFLAPLRSRSDLPTELTSLDPAASLRTILTNGTVLEFPTMYVIETGQRLPTQFTVAPKLPTATTRRQQQQQHQKGIKRKPAPDTMKQSGSTKRQRQRQRQQLEDGEVGSDDDADADADVGGAQLSDNQDDDGDSVDNNGGKAAVGLEAGEVIDEQSFGEEDDDDTSSSGSDSD